MIKALSIAAVIAIAGTTTASADWQRNVTTTGPNGGVWTQNASGSCSGGSCTSQKTWTGPQGRSWSRQGSATCSGGQCNGTTTWRGAGGRTWTRSRSVRRY